MRSSMMICGGRNGDAMIGYCYFHDLGRVVVGAVVLQKFGIQAEVRQMNWCCWKMRYMRVEVAVVVVLDCSILWHRVEEVGGYHCCLKILDVKILQGGQLPHPD